MPAYHEDYAARLDCTNDFAKKRDRFQRCPDLFEPSDYPAAVSVLLELTRIHSGTGGAVRAAQVLLNAYNGSRFPFDPSELYYLDPDLRTAAFSVMWGRIVTGREPHELLNTPEEPARGSKIFEALIKDYPRQFKRVSSEEDC